MSKKSHCIDCGTPIMALSEWVRGGRCMKCYRKRRETGPPEDFSLPAELCESVANSERDENYLLNLGWTDGVERLRSMLRMDEKIRDLKSTWQPRLFELAENDKRRALAQSRDTTSRKAREMQRVLSEKLGTGPAMLPDSVAICTVPSWAMELAQERLTSMKSTCVLLTPEGKAEWNSLYRHPSSVFWWFSFFDWELDASPNIHCSWGEENPLRDEEVPAGYEPWLVRVGVTHGPLSGGGHTELWLWDGVGAYHLRDVSWWIS